MGFFKNLSIELETEPTYVREEIKQYFGTGSEQPIEWDELSKRTQKLIKDLARV